MDCEYIKTKGLLLSAIEGELSREDEGSLKSHLSSCPGCGEEFYSLKEMMGKLKAQPVPEPGEEFWLKFPERVRTDLEAERKKQAESNASAGTGDAGPRWWHVTGRTRIWMRRFAPAAAIAVLIAVGMFLGQTSKDNDRLTGKGYGDEFAMTEEELIEVGKRLTLASELEGAKKSMLDDIKFNWSADIGLYYDLYQLDQEELTQVYKRLDALSVSSSIS